MQKAESVVTKECPVKMKLVAPPAYVLTTQTLDKVFKKYLSICSFRSVRSPTYVYGLFYAKSK